VRGCNCTTWAGEIQRGKVITDTLGISAPGFCRSKKGNSEKKVYEIVKYYIDDNVQGLLRLLNPFEGGRLKTRKYRKHYKRKTRKQKTRKQKTRKTIKHYKRKY